MTLRHDPADEPFFREWNNARRRETGRVRTISRSRARSALLQQHLGLTRDLPVPACLIVGSKGKGTAVAAATATLHAAGLRVGTITSPPLRHNRERIRVDGAAASQSDYEAVSRRAARALDCLPAPHAGYLPPSGMFTLVGLRWLLDAEVDVLVVEEGLGGLSDDVSLFSYPAVGVTQIFSEHLDVLGGSLDAVAADLLGVIDEATERVVAFSPQPPQAQTRLPPNTVPIETGATLERNIRVGAETARSLLAVSFPDRPHQALPNARELADKLILPGRASLHAVDGAQWCIDTSISPEGVADIRGRAERILRPGFRVLAAFPDVKDVEGCIAELDGLPVTFVGAGREYLNYTRSQAGTTTQKAAHDARTDGCDVLAVGTQSFAGELLELLEVETDRWW
ncbi:hypothetical protein [Brevibacterium sp. Marseille-P9724]|uniref:hypothetical protein n=1 Tax=Brevibacterium sp. Marseille-P9724 TaxID=2614125 RepID=UPI00125F7861|nr:hypothetical protein [Brevibacterium sp. Marseille-P9724]